MRPIPKIPGVYLQTFEYQNGYLIYAAGLTRRLVPSRSEEHTREYMNDKYHVLDINAAQQGVRNEVWHGWGYARKHREEFEERKSIILDTVGRQLTGRCIFVAEMGREPRVLERLEASIMNNEISLPTGSESTGIANSKANSRLIVHGGTGTVFPFPKGP